MCISTAVAVCFILALCMSNVNNEPDEILGKTAHVVHITAFGDPQNLLQTTEALFKQM